MITLDTQNDIVQSKIENEDFTIELQAKLNVIQLLQSQSIIQFFLNDQEPSLKMLALSNTDYIDNPKSVFKRSMLTLEYLYRHFRNTGFNNGYGSQTSIKFDSTDTYPVEVCFDSEPTVETHNELVEDIRSIFRVYTFLEEIDC